MDRAMQDLQSRLEDAFAAASAIYQKRGFQRRIGFGRKPALVIVDMANAWTRPGYPFTCEKIEEQLIPAHLKLLEACREHNFPVVFTTTCFQVVDPDNPNTDMGLWHKKIPIEVADYSNEDIWAIDSRIAPIKGEQIMIKKRASAFHGTYLAGYLRAIGVDTILVTGVTASACVRATITDGIADGFRTIAVREAIGDRIPGAVEWNLFDIDAKFGDVESVDSCLAYLNTVNFRND